MPRARNEELAKLIFMKRASGMTFTAIAVELGISKQRAQQIFKAKEIYKLKKDVSFFSLRLNTRLRIRPYINLNIEEKSITPFIIADNIYAGDLKSMGAAVFAETEAWLNSHGFSVKEGYKKFQTFSGSWRAVTTHWSDGRKAPWVADRVYEVEALSRNRARVRFREQWFEMSIDDLKVAFSRETSSEI